MYYNRTYKVNGRICAMITRNGYASGTYKMVFEREFNTIDELEDTDWTNIVVEELRGQKSPIPEGYTFELKGIEYTSYNRSFVVTIATSAKCYGDITGYQEEINSLNEEKKQLSDDLAEADALVIELYEQLDGAQETEEAEG